MLELKQVPEILEVRGESDSGGGNNALLRSPGNNIEASENSSSNGMIHDFPMMDPLQFQDRAFQQELLQLSLSISINYLVRIAWLHVFLSRFDSG